MMNPERFAEDMERLETAADIGCGMEPECGKCA